MHYLNLFIHLELQGEIHNHLVKDFLEIMNFRHV